MIVMACMCGLGCFMMIFAFRLGIGAPSDPGSGLMPLIIGASLCLLSLWGIAAGAMRSKGAPTNTEPREPVKRKKMVIVLISLLLYGALLEPLGFPITTAIFLFVIFWMMGVGRNAAMLTSVIVALVNFFGFGYLGLRFPPGLFRFLGFH